MKKNKGVTRADLSFAGIRKINCLTGFTLIELLVVIAIISILLVMSLYSYTHVRKQARDVRRHEDIASIAGALQLYYQDNNSYVSLNTTATSFQNVNSASTFKKQASYVTLSNILSDVTNKYIDLPVAALSSYPYEYCSSDGSNYVLRAKLEIPRGDNLGTDTSCTSSINYYSGDYKNGTDGYASKSSGYN